MVYKIQYKIYTYTSIIKQKFSIDTRKTIRGGNAIDTRRYTFFIKIKIIEIKLY
jgi:hypothetical protein